MSGTETAGAAAARRMGRTGRVDGGGLRNGEAGAPRKALHALLIVALSSSALSPAFAQTAPVSTAPISPADSRTSLDVTPGGTPVVNIAAPDAQGTSHNVFTALSAGKEGLVFNNSAEVGQSTIGGFLLANPNLTRNGQGAGLILNEVTGGVRTTLAGPVEVFGKQAGLVIANPTGISCDGCGFINISRVTLAAGKLAFAGDGAFSGIIASGGDVSLEGQGLLGGNVDYFDIVAGAAHLNASLYARDLVVAGGPGARFDYAARTAGGGTGSGIAIDSTLLGGMYANRIRLIGTGQGVGINLLGTAAALDGALAISADGDVTVGQTYSSGDSVLDSGSGAVTLTGQAYAGGNLAITGQRIAQSGGAQSGGAQSGGAQSGGLAGALGDVTLSSTGDVALGGGGVYAGLGSDGTLTGASALTIRAGNVLDLGDTTLAASGAIDFSGASIALQDQGQVFGQRVTLIANERQTLAGTLAASGDIAIAGGEVDVTGTVEAGGALALSGRDIHVAGMATGLSALSASAENALTVAHGGTLQTNGNAGLVATDLGIDGALSSGQNLVLTAGNLASRGTVASGGDIAADIKGNAALSGTWSANGATAITAGGAATLDGSLGARGPVRLDAQSIELTGELASADTLALSGDGVSISGTAQAQGRLTLSAASLDLSGRAASAGDIAATATQAADIAGTLSASGNLSLTAPTISTGSDAQVVAGQAIAIAASDALTHRGVLSANAVTLSADSLRNTGTAIASGELTLDGISSVEQAGIVQAGGNLTLRAPAITLTGQTVGAVDGGDAGVSLEGQRFAFGMDSDLQSGGALSLYSPDDFTIAGTILALGALALRSDGALIQAADIVSGDAVALGAGALLDQQGSVSATGPIHLAAARITNSGTVAGENVVDLTASDGIVSTGALLANGALSLTAPDLALGGIVATNDWLTLAARQVSVEGRVSGLAGVGGSADNLSLGAGGALQSGADFDLALGTLDNAGLISSDGALRLGTRGSFANSGQIAAGTALALSAADGLESSGLLQAGSLLTADIAGAARLGGVVYSGGEARISAGELRSTGALSADNSFTIAVLADAVLAAGSTTYAASQLSLAAANLDLAGIVQSDGTLTVDTQQALSLGGDIQVAGDTTLTAGSQATITGTLASNGALSLTAPTVDIPGTIRAGNSVDIAAQRDNLSLTGSIGAIGDVSLTALHKLTIGSATGQAGGPAMGGDSGGTGGTGGSAGGSGDSGAPIDPPAGSAGFTQDIPQLAVAVPGSLATEGSVLLSGETIDLFGIVTAKGDLTALASHVFAIDGSAWSDSGLTAKVGAMTIGANGSLASVGSVAVQAVGDVVNSGTLASNAGDIALDLGGSFANSGSLLAGGSYRAVAAADYTDGGTVSATRIDIAGNTVTLAGLVSASEAVMVSGQAITLQAGSDIGSGGTLALAGTTDLTLAGRALATTDLTAHAGRTLEIASAAQVEAAGTLSLNAEGNLASQAGSQLLAGNALDVSATRLSLAGAATSNAALSLSAADALSIGGTVTALGNARVAARGAFDLAGTLAGAERLTLTAGEVTLAAGSLIQSGTLLDVSSAALDARGTLQAADGISISTLRDMQLAGQAIAGTVAPDGAVTNLGSVSLQSTGALVLTGAVSATGNGNLSATNLTLNGDLVALGDITLNATDLTTGGSVQANGTLRAHAGETVTFGGTVAGLAGIVAASDGALVQAGDLGSNGAIALGAAGALTHSGSTRAAGDISLTAASLALAGEVTANGALSLGSTSTDLAVTSGAVLSGQAVTITSARDAIIAGSIAGTERLTSNIAGALTIADSGTLSAGTVDASGNVTGIGAMALQSGTTIVNRGTIFSTGSLGFDTPSLVNTGAIGSGDDINLTAASISLGGTFLSLGDIAIATTAGDLDLSGGLEGRTIVLSSAGGDLNLGAQSHLTAFGSATEGFGTIALTSTGAIDATGVIVGNGDVSLRGGTTIHIGPDRAGAEPANALATQGSISLVANGALTNEGTVEALGNISLSAASLASNNLVADGTIGIDTAGAAAFSGTTDSAKGVRITAISGAVSLADTATLHSLRAIEVSAGGDLTNRGLVSAGPASAADGAAPLGAVALTSGGALASTGGIVSNDSSVALTGQSITLGGAFANGGGTYAATSLELNAPTLSVADGGQVVANAALGYTGRTLSIGANGLLQSNGGIAIALGGAGAAGSYVSSGNLVALGDLALAVTGGAIANNAGAGIYAGGSGDTDFGGSLSLAGDSLANAGTIVATASLAGGSGGNIAISAPVITNGGLIHADRALALTADSLTIDGTRAGADNNLGTIEAGSALDLSIPAIMLVSGGQLRSASDITLNSNTLSNAGAILAGGDLTITTLADLTSSGILAAPGALSLTSGTELTLATGSQTYAGPAQATLALTESAITLAGPSVASLGTLVATGSLGIAADSFTVSGVSLANGDIALGRYSSGAAGPVFAIAAGGVLETRLGNADLGTLASATLAGTLLAQSGDVRFSSGATTVAGTGQIAAGGDLVLASTGDLAVDGQLLANADVTLTGGILTVGAAGAIQAGHDLTYASTDTGASTGAVTINARSFDLTDYPISARIMGRLAAGNDLLLTMPGVLLVDGGAQITAIRDIGITAGQTVFGARYLVDSAGNPASYGIAAGRDFRFSNSAGDPLSGQFLRGLLVDGSVQAGRDLTIAAGGLVETTASAQLLAGNVLSVSGAALDLSGLNSGIAAVDLASSGTVPAGTIVPIVPGDIRLSGVTVSDGRIGVTGKAVVIDSNGSITARGGAGNQVAIGRDIGDQANIAIVADGVVDNYGTIWSDGVVFLKSANADILNDAGGTNGGITARAIVVQTGSGTFRNTRGAFSASDVGIFLGGDFINTGSFAPTGNYWVGATNIVNSGLLATSGDLRLQAAQDLTNSGTIYAGGDLVLTAGRTLTNDYVGDNQGNGSHGLILAQNDIAITAHDVINQSATIQSLAGGIEIELTGGDFTNRVKSLAIADTGGLGGGDWGDTICIDNIDGACIIYWESTSQDVGGKVLNFTSQSRQLGNPYCEGVYYTGTYNCSPSSLGPDYYVVSWVDDSFSIYSPAPEVTFLYKLPSNSSSGGTTSTFTGTATLSAATDITINGHGGNITNRNSAILAGGDIAIATTGKFSNIADLLVTTGADGTTRTNTVIPGAPTIVQAGGTVAIAAGSIDNTSVNALPGSAYATSLPVEHAAPGLPGSGAPQTGSGANGAGGSTSRTTGLFSLGGIEGGTGSTGGGGGGVRLFRAGHGATIGTSTSGEYQGQRAGAAGLSVSQAASATQVDMLGQALGASSVSSVLSGRETGSVTTAARGVSGISLVSRRFAGESATATAGENIGDLTGVPTGAATADLDLAADYGTLSPGAIGGIGGADLPYLSGTGFGGFLDGFLKGFNIGNPNASLFTYSDNPNSAYLYTTDARLSSQAALYDSTWFFDRVAPDRATTYTRLGDGFFEALLVSREVQAATGRAQLSGFGSALDQYEGLLRNATAAQGALDLKFGVALTAAQVSQLASPLLWYVSTTVNGREVLVPVLYLAASDTKALANGALIAGDNVLLSANGGITNSGTIRASQIVALSASGGDIVNRTGGVITGGSVVAHAAQDIVMQGGSTISANGSGAFALPGGTIIPGGTVALDAGRDIRAGTIANTTVSTSGFRRNDRDWANSTTSQTTLTGATVDASQAIQLTAGRDITFDAARITSGGSVGMAAGRDVTLGGGVETTTTTFANRTGKYTNAHGTATQSTFVGTSIAANGPVAIEATGGTLSIIGGSIDATGPNANLLLRAGQAIDIGAGQSTYSSSQFAQTAKRHTVSTVESGTINSLAAISADGSIGIVTPGQLSIGGGTLTADADGNGSGALVARAGGIAITGAIDSADYSRTTIDAKKGLLYSRTTTTQVTSHSEGVASSTLSGDTVSLGAVGDIDIAGSNVVAANGVVISSDSGAITVGAQLTHNSSYTLTKEKKSGISFDSGLFLGSSKQENTYRETGLTGVGSLIGSTAGDVTLDAAGALTVSDSQVLGTGTTTLAGESVTVEHGTDILETRSTSKSSSFGVTVGVSSPLLSAAKGLVQATQLATNSKANERTQALAGLAGGLAARNAYDAGKDVANAITKGGELPGVRVSASIGFSKSESQDRTHDETIVASQVTGGDVNVVARGSGDAGFVRVTGSDITATNDVLIAANGPITLESAREHDTQSGTAKSSGASVGVSAGVSVGGGKVGAQGLSVDVGFHNSNSSYSGAQTSYRESTVSAGGTARVTTPGALSLEGATLSGDRVEIDAGSLAIASDQDTATYTARSNSVGFDASISPVGGGGSVSGNFSNGRQDGDYASVVEQSGIYAGAGGLDVAVAGETRLSGGVIASQGSDNRLATGTLVAEDLANRESWSASQTSLGGSFGFGGGGGSTTGGTSANSKGAGTPLPGIETALGNLSATLPATSSDSGSQQGTTYSAIADGTQVTIASGDAASLAAAQALSRDTAQANAGALVRAFDDARREEISLGFEAAQLLSGQTAVFLANRAQDAKEWDAEHPGEDPAKSPYATWGAGGVGNIVLTALNGAASGKVTGSLGGLVQASAVNVLQSLAVSEVKQIADKLGSEEARAGLQALTACGGAVASGQGDCGGAALGAAASVVLNNLLDLASTPKNKDLNGDGDYADPGESLTLEEQQARTNLVATLIGAIAEGAGLNTTSAVNAGLIETQNNALVPTKGSTGETRLVCTAGEAQCQNALPFEEWSKAVEGSSEREEYDDIRAVLGLDRGDEDALNVLKAIYWGQVPIKDALVYIKRGYSWEQASAIWEENKNLGEGGVFSPINTSNWNGYLVESGDTLSSILIKVPGMRMIDLLAANPTIDPNAIDAGQIIHLPTQDFIDSNNAAKLTFVRLNHYLEQTGGVIPDGVSLTNLPAFEGEDEAVAKLNVPADKLAAAWVATHPSIKGLAQEEAGTQTGGATNKVDSPYSGGPHRETSRSAGDGLDSHHCPAKNCYQGASINSADGPAIQMDPADHRLTSSYGNSAEAQAYRAEQQRLLNEGRVQEAIQMDIDDIRRIENEIGQPGKYDTAIQQLQDYANTLKPHDFIRP